MLGEGTKSSPKIFANILIAFIGAGILGVPFAFKEAGVIEGILVLIFVGFLSTNAMLLLIDCKYKILSTMPGHTKLVSLNGDKSKGKNDHELPIQSKDPLKLAVYSEIEFGDIGKFAMGKSGIIMVDSFVVLSQIGFCCAYLIFISENFANFITSFNKEHFLFAMVIPLILLTNVRHLHNLSIFSLFADFANIFAYCVVFWFDFENYQNMGKETRTFTIKGLPFFIGVAVYCYEGAGMILSLESSVAKCCREKFTGIFKLAMLVITTLYLTFGICGYLSFGDDTQNIITLNLPAGKFPVIVKCCLMFSLFFTYPIMMFPVSRILEMRLFKDPKNKDYYKCSLMRVGLVAVTILVVLGIPNFSTLMALIGSSCCILLGLILPGMFHLKIFAGELTICQRLVDYLIIALGIVGSFLGTRDAIKRLFDGS